MRDREHGGLFERNIRKLIARAIEERRLIDAPLPPEVNKDTPKEFEYKADRLARAEAVLTQARLLFDLRSASAFVPAIWRDWATLLAEENVELYAKAQPWWDEFADVCERERFFHWELEFPEVFFGVRGGFDVVLGNPPWDKVLPARSEFYGRKDILIRAYAGNELDSRIKELHAGNPGLRDEFEAYQKRTKALADLLRRGGDFSLSRGRTAAAHEDLSKFFFERAITITRAGGSIGLLLPSVVYNGDGCSGLRKWLLTDATIRCFYGFENREKIFPIHASYKFVCLVFQKAAPETSEFVAAFMRHDLAELGQSGPHPWEVHISADEVRNLSPESFAFLEYRGPRDQKIVRKMYQSEVRLAGTGPGSWGIQMFTDLAHTLVFNASRDKDLWTDPETGKLYDPRLLLGTATVDPIAMIEGMNQLGFIPVYEGKHIEQFLYGTKPIRWWLNVERARTKYPRAAPNEPLFVFRETASNTNQRTCIAAILPRGSAASHKLTAVKVRHVDPEAAATVFNSFCFDYALRMRTAGTNISFTYMDPMPVPPAGATNVLPRVLTICGWNKACEFITDRKDLWPDLWAANRAVAEAYGLDADDFAHIIGSFDAFRRKRPEFTEFLVERVEEWANSIG